MTRATPVPTSGSILCLVQMSDSMRTEVYSGLVRTKLDAARRVINRVIDSVVSFAAKRAVNQPSFVIGVVAYHTGADGSPRFCPLLPGSSPEQPLVPVISLDPSQVDSPPDEPRRWIDLNPSGGAPGRAARSHTHVKCSSGGQRIIPKVSLHSWSTALTASRMMAPWTPGLGPSPQPSRECF